MLSPWNRFHPLLFQVSKYTGLFFQPTKIDQKSKMSINEISNLPGMKNFRRGKGTRLVASFLKSAFN